MWHSINDRSGALAGIAFVILLAVAGVLAGQPPSATASDTEITQYLADHEAALLAGISLLGLAALSLLWWFGSLWPRMVQTAADNGRLPVVSLAGLLLAGPLALISAVLLGAAAAHVNELGPTTPFLYDLASMLQAAEGFGLATHLLATNLLAARTHFLRPGWVALGFASASLFLVTALLSASGVDANGTIGLLAFVLWCVWIVGVSANLWSDQTGRTKPG